MTVKELHAHISSYFDFKSFINIDTINGIQVDHSAKEIEHIGVAVDASLPIIQTATKHNIDVLCVHHGLYWNNIEPIVNVMYEKVSHLIKNNTALYAIHLPLDAHMKLGNNICLAQKIQLKHCVPFGNYKNCFIGVTGYYDTGVTPQNVIDMLFPVISNDTTVSPIALYAQQHGATYKKAYTYPKEAKAPVPLAVALHGPEKIHKVAIVTGGGVSYLKEAAECDAEMLITGDASHTYALVAEELKIHLISAGHYFTEIWGVLALGKYIIETIKKVNKEDTLTLTFIDNPTAM